MESERTKFYVQVPISWIYDFQAENCVYNNDRQAFREISEIEKLIVEYCVHSSNHLNEACARLSENKTNQESYNTKDLKDAGQAIYQHEIHSKERKSKLVKQLVEKLPKYLECTDDE